MNKIIFIILVIIFSGCVSSKFYSYNTDSVIASSVELESASIQYDSLEIEDIKPGYYYKILPIDTADKINYNLIDWIYLSKDNKVKLFLTADFEYCMMHMYWKDKPKEIYKQIKRNKEEFDELYLDCNQQEFVPSRLKKNNDAIIVMYPKEGGVIDSDELIFVKGGLTRKIRNYEGIISMEEYIYIGR